MDIDESVEEWEYDQSLQFLYGDRWSNNRVMGTHSVQ